MKINKKLIKIPISWQVFLFTLITTLTSIIVTLFIYGSYTQKLIEDEIVNNYLKQSDAILTGINPVLNDYKIKINDCIKNNLCDPSYIEEVPLSKRKDLTPEQVFYEKENDIKLIYNESSGRKFLISIDIVHTLLIEISLKFSEEIYLINAKGIVLLNITGNVPFGKSILLEKETLSQLKAKLTQGAFYLKENDITSLYVFRIIPELDLYLVYGKAQSKVFSDINKVTDFAIIYFSISIPFTILLSLGFSHLIKKRISKFLVRIKRITSGNYSERLDTNSIYYYDEYVELADAFNRMVSSLEKFHSMNVEKILEMNEELEILVKELREAKQLADSANKTKSLFLANMSHEIRTPMNGILGTIQIIESSSLDEEQMKLISMIKTSANNLLAIINDILDISKIEAGKIELEEISYDVKKLLVEIVDSMRIQAKEKGNEIELIISDSFPEYILGDQVRIRQILLNLMSNANKFTDRGKIFLEAKVLEEGDPFLLSFLVRDTGIGISEDKIEKIFESFSQADASTTRKYGGTGLGLSISKKLIHLMGGELKVKSKVGEGSEFSFQIIAKKGFAIAKTLSVQNFEKIKWRDDLKILVAEDDPINQRVLSKLLLKINLKVKMVDNGYKVLEELDSTLYDLIFMDVQMPLMDGITTTKEIRKKFSLQSPIIIALTANAMKEDQQICLGAGMNDFLTKPYFIEDLQRILLKWIGDESRT